MNTTHPPSHNGTHPEGGSVLVGANPVKFNPDNPLPLFIIQATLIISLCYLLNLVLSRLRQPRVISEVMAGILLGPSIMGKIPHFHDTIFPEPSLPFLNLVSSIGLVLFLFLIGLELDPKLVLQRARRALGISIGGIALPFGLGAALSLLLYKHLEEPGETVGVSIGEFILFCGVAMSITAFPVLARILADMKLLGTSVGFLTVCAGAVGDIVAWILLALVVSIINSASPITPLYVVLLAIGWCLILIFAVRPLILFLVRITHSEEEPSQTMMAFTVLVVLVSAFVTDIIGIHAIFGGFLVGLLIPHDSGFAEGLTRRLEDLVGVIFLPIYFALSGLKTQIGLLNNAEAWGLVVLVTLVACTGKIVGCSVAALLNGMTWRESLAIGFLMNCKGLVELIVLNIGYDAGVINDKVFVVMVAMCIITTMMATPFVRLVFPVAYQKEIEAKRARELKQRDLDDSNDLNDPNDESTFTLEEEKSTYLFPGVRQRKGGMASTAGTINNNIDGLPPHFNLADLASNVTVQESLHNPRHRGILFCLDKSANAPSVMTMLQLFSGTAAAAAKAMPRSSSSFQHASHHQRNRSSLQIPEPYPAHVLQPPLDPMSASAESTSGRFRDSHLRVPTATRSGQPLTVPVFTLRMLSISERATSVMLTASRCLDRLYKDTVMMMVMAFSKLNHIAVQPLVTLSTDVASSDAADDILDQVLENDVACVIFPWNSSHLTDLGASERTAGSSNSLVPLSAHPTSISNADLKSQTPLRHRIHTNASEATTSEFGLNRGPRHIHEFFRFPRLFDHDEAHRVTSGGQVDLSESGRHHRTSVTSNTKVLSKLLRSCPQHHIATGVLVDRGLGLVGGIQHIVVPLFGGKDDEETLLLAASLASNPAAKCFVSILRVTQQQQQQQQPHQWPTLPVYRHVSMTESTQRSRQPTQDPQVPVMRAATDLHFSASEDFMGATATASAAGKGGAGGGGLAAPPRVSESLLPGELGVPKDDESLLQTFFPAKPRFKGPRPMHHRMPTMDEHHTQGDVAEPLDIQEDGVIVLHFHNMADVTHWAKHCLTVQDLMVVGADAPTQLQQLWYSGRFEAGSSSSNTLRPTGGLGGKSGSGVWQPEDGVTMFRFSVDAPTPLYSPPLGSSASIFEQQAAAAAINLTRPLPAVVKEIASPPRDDSKRQSVIQTEHNPSSSPPPLTSLTAEGDGASGEDDNRRPSMTLSPHQISIPTHHHHRNHSRVPSSPTSPTHPRTSLSSISYYPRPSFQSQRTTTTAAPPPPMASTGSGWQGLHDPHHRQQLNPLASPLALRRALSGKGFKNNGIGGGGGDGTSGSDKLGISSSCTSAVPPLRPVLVPDSSRQTVLGPAVEFFIQSQIQTSYLVVRSRIDRSSSPSVAPTPQRGGASSLLSVSSPGPVISRSGTAVSAGAGVGADTLGGGGGGASHLGLGASRTSMSQSRAAMEVSSPPLSMADDTRRQYHAQQRRHHGSRLSQPSIQQGQDHQQLSSPVNEARVSFDNTHLSP